MLKHHHLANRNSLIIADKFCHASIIDGAVLSRGKLLRYKHQDRFHAEKLLNSNIARQKILITESIFSMQGAITYLPDFVTLAKHHHAFFLLDDAHAVGILGETGSGSCEHFYLTADAVTCLMTPFGKAMGNNGAALSGSKEIIESILQLARPYRYSTAISPALCLATIAAIHIIKNESWRRRKLLSLINFFHETAQQLNLPFMPSYSPIQCLVLHSIEKTIAMQQKLLNKNILVACIRPPTVPKNTARIRIALNIIHTEEDIVLLLQQVKLIYEQLNKN